MGLAQSRFHGVSIMNSALWDSRKTVPLFFYNEFCVVGLPNHCVSIMNSSLWDSRQTVSLLFYNEFCVVGLPKGVLGFEKVCAQRALLLWFYDDCWIEAVLASSGLQGRIL